MSFFLHPILDVLRTTMTGGFSGIAYDISPPFGSIVKLGPEQFSTRWTAITDTTLSYLGSLFGNPIIFALGLYWLIRSKLKEVSNIFIVVFLSIGSVPLFFGNWFVQAGILRYTIPNSCRHGSHIFIPKTYRRSHSDSSKHLACSNVDKVSPELLLYFSYMTQIF